MYFSLLINYKLLGTVVIYARFLLMKIKFYSWFVSLNGVVYFLFAREYFPKEIFNHVKKLLFLLHIAPITALRTPNMKQRLWKEQISFEHQYNSRSDPSYPVRGKVRKKLQSLSNDAVNMIK